MLTRSASNFNFSNLNCYLSLRDVNHGDDTIYVINIHQFVIIVLL